MTKEEIIELIRKFIESFGEGENITDYDEVFYNKSKSIGVNMVSFLEDFAEYILDLKTKELQERVDYAENGHLAIQKDCDKLFIENQQLQAKIDELEKANEWISVKDRLPEHYESILIFLPKREYNTDKNILQASYHAIQNEFYSMYAYEDEIIKPTHWKPLPQAPTNKSIND